MGRKNLWMQYASLSIVTGLLLIGPFFRVSLTELLIFCGGWSNFVAFYAMLRTFRETEENIVRAVLAAQSFILILILGFDLDRWLGREWLLTAAFIPVALMMVRIGRHVFRGKPGLKASKHIPTANEMDAAWDAIVPPFFLLLSLLVVINTEKIVHLLHTRLFPIVASHIGLPPAFLDARDHIYLHLLFIPVLYLGGDLLMRRYSPVAKRSVPLDVIIFVVGLACCSCGLASFRHAASTSTIGPVDGLFESGSVAAVLLLGNWIFTLYVEKFQPHSVGTT
jgi:hypothetical protein